MKRRNVSGCLLTELIYTLIPRLSSEKSIIFVDFFENSRFQPQKPFQAREKSNTIDKNAKMVVLSNTIDKNAKSVVLSNTIEKNAKMVVLSNTIDKTDGCGVK